MKRIASVILLTAIILPLAGKDIVLMEKGKSKCVIVKSDAKCPVQNHAAKELALYLGKIGNGEKPAITDKAVKGKAVITFQILKKDKFLKDDGFRLTAKGNTITISALKGRGLLYGAYEILKRYGGIRWLIPGAEGEYYKVKSLIKVPEGKYEKNADFFIRKISAVCMNSNSPIWETWDWGMRNNMSIMPGSWVQRNKKFNEFHLSRGSDLAAGGHVFSYLLTHRGIPDPVTGKVRNGKEQEEYEKKLFAEHPDYYPLINGKRVRIRHGGSEPQPCTSHPDVIERAAQWVVATTKRTGVPVVIGFGNNDYTKWCECKRCLASDVPSERAKGNISTRYWKFINAVNKRAKELDKNVLLQGWTYQNYSVVPEGVKPDLSIHSLMISNHSRCWKHALNDKNCPTNKWYYDYNKSWQDTGVPLFTYDMLSRAGTLFFPLEKVWVDTLKYYNKAMPNYQGMCTEISCPDGIYPASRYNVYAQTTQWKRMWQSMYMAMSFHWDVKGDYNKIYEEANSFYYGKGWEGGMRDFRKLLTKLYDDAAGCWGYAHSVPVGRYLDKPYAKEKLLKYLDAAEKAAAKDPDRRALKHCKETRNFFMETWVKAYDDYIKNYREIKAFPLMGKIVIDGKLDELDWKNADTNTRFTKAFGKGLAKYQSIIKLAYDKDTLYIAGEFMEPDPKNVKVMPRKHDGATWEDNGVEIFLNDPIMGGTYYQLIINSDGVMCDGTHTPGQKGITRSYESQAKIKTKWEKDRWILEMSIPVKNITGSIFKPGTVIKMNVMRNRGSVNRKENEHSTWSIGTPHSVEVFHPVTMAAPRTNHKTMHREMDTRLFRNGSFNETIQNGKKPKHWKVKDGLTPRHWFLSEPKNYGGELEMLLHPGTKNNYFARIKSGYIAQGHKVKDKKMRLSLRLRGKGSMRIFLLRYPGNWKGSRPSKTIAILNEINNPEWKQYIFDFDNPAIDAAENQILGLWITGKTSQIDIDDCYLGGK